MGQTDGWIALFQNAPPRAGYSKPNRGQVSAMAVFRGRCPDGGPMSGRGVGRRLARWLVPL